MGHPYLGVLSIPRSFFTKQVQVKIEEEGLEDTSDMDKVLSFSYPAAEDGWFEDLENFLIDHQIPFDRYSEARLNYPPEKRFFRPQTGNKEKVDITKELSSNGVPYVETDRLKELLKDEKHLWDLLLKTISETDPYVKPLKEY